MKNVSEANCEPEIFTLKIVLKVSVIEGDRNLNLLGHYHFNDWKNQKLKYFLKVINGIKRWTYNQQRDLDVKHKWRECRIVYGGPLLDQYKM